MGVATETVSVCWAMRVTIGNGFILPVIRETRVLFMSCTHLDPFLVRRAHVPPLSDSDLTRARVSSQHWHYCNTLWRAQSELIAMHWPQRKRVKEKGLAPNVVSWHISPYKEDKVRHSLSTLKNKESSYSTLVQPAQSLMTSCNTTSLHDHIQQWSSLVQWPMPYRN